MKRYSFRLEPVLRVRRIEEDRAVLELANATRQLVAAQETLDRRVDRYGAVPVPQGPVPVDQLLRMRARLDGVAASVVHAGVERLRAEANVDTRRQLWSDAATRVAALARRAARRPAARPGRRHGGRSGRTATPRGACVVSGTSAVAEAQARVAEIRATFASMTPRREVAVPGGGADFASALGRAESMYRPGGVEVTGNDVIAAATRYLGVPYRWGGTDPATGLDCSGFVQQVYDDLGIDLPRVSRDQARAGVAVPDLASARAGDLIAFGEPVDHIGIYVGHGRMIVAPRTGDVVKVQDVRSDWTHIRRVLPDPPGAGFGGGGGASPYASLFEQAGARYGIDPSVLAAVARAESGYNPLAVSPAGAQGLMQLMPGTAKGLGVDAFDPAQAVDGAARLLSDHIRQFGSLPLALAAYNAGPGAVTRYGGIPPYRETQGYVTRILDDLRSEAS